MIKELEVKVLNIDLEEMENKIIELGGILIGKEHQINTIIDSSEKPIKSYIDAYLRIRETKDVLKQNKYTTLTLKKNIKNKSLRENIELDTDIEDKDMMLSILKELGFDKTVEGFKERTSYILGNARIELDRWDMGTYPYPYMEIEVDSEKTLEETIRILNIEKKNISTKSIMELRKEVGLE